VKVIVRTLGRCQNCARSAARGMDSERSPVWYPSVRPLISFPMRTRRPLFSAGLVTHIALVCGGAQAAEGDPPPAHPAPALNSPLPERGSVESDPVPYPTCPGGPDADAMVAARGAFDAGNAAFNEADYARALLYWEDAYRRDCTAHAMLRNLGRAYELDGQLKHAVLAIETYLERVKDSPETQALLERVESLKAKLAEQSSARSPARSETPASHAADVQGSSANPEPTPFGEEGADDAENEPSRSLLPLLPAGVGAAVVGLSAVQWFAAKRDENAAAKACPIRENCASGVADAGNRAVDREIVWTVVGAGGAALVVTGVAWYFLQEPTGSSNVTATLTPQFFGVSWSGRY
jgi:hypothetical protein